MQRYSSSVSESLEESGTIVRTISYSVTRITPGAGSSTTSIIVSSTGSLICGLRAFLTPFFSSGFRERFLLAADSTLAFRTLDLVWFRPASFAGFLRGERVRAFRLFRLFRPAAGLFDLAMAASVVPGGEDSLAFSGRSGLGALSDL
jgi:hypothetical protein